MVTDIVGILANMRFILTMWDVNIDNYLLFYKIYEGFILTIWDVNKGKSLIVNSNTSVLSKLCGM